MARSGRTGYPRDTSQLAALPGRCSHLALGGGGRGGEFEISAPQYEAGMLAKSGHRQYRDYTEETLLFAIEDIQKGVTEKDASKIYNIHIRTS
ncbi:hypothetical protein RRG08_001817 [Elysia crispata]|uniref:Uncharacterized protein n=1 Tax=Elysia crispata TaxID=231223 RepID=A0AAE1CU39_9GAST|nr:hypothetical protein RRG08_001817 [Elysia crispata]